MSQSERPIEVFLVEDDSGDVRLIIEALKASRAPMHLNVAEDGVEAMAYLRQERSYRNAVRPDVVLLDLNMPRKDGREVLAEIRQDPHLESLPVMVLTTSDAIEDKARARELKADCFMTKPVVWDDFIKIVGLIECLWIRTLELKSGSS